MMRQGTLALVPLVAIGFGLSLAAGWTFRQQESRAILEEFEAAVIDRAGALEREIDLNLEVVLSLKDLYDATGDVGREEFAAYARRAIRRHPSVQALEWIPRVAASQRARYEEAARRDGLAGFRFTERQEAGRMVRAGDRDEYFPVYFVEPHEGNEAAMGFDLGSNAARREALERSRDTGAMRATPPIRLVQEPENRPGFLVFAPVYRGEPATVDERRRALAGFMLGVYRVYDIAEVALAAGGQLRNAVIRLVDESDPGPGTLFGPVGAGAAAAGNELRRPFDVAGRRWVIAAAPRSEYFNDRRTLQPHAAFVVGLLLTAGLTGYVFAADSRARAVERLVEARTQDLLEANQQLEEQRGILQSVLDNLGDGVVVADAQGRLTMFNLAAERILGRGRVDSGPDEWSELYGLFRPDTTTPIPADELPLTLALGGRESRDVEMFVRNPQRRGGGFIRVTATPLRDRQGGLMGGVAVFRDISERKWAEAVLKDSEARFRAIVEATASALIILSPEFRIREFNPRAGQIFGLGRAEALGQDFLELCLPEEYREAVASDVRKVLAGEVTPGFEIPVASRDGGDRTLLWSFSRLAEAGDRESVVIATGHDITERRQAERSRRVRELAAHLQSAREEERTRVAREIHDELGQALTGLKLEVSYLSRRAGEGGAGIRQRLESVGRMIDGTIASVRRIAADLRPQILDALGLVEAIRWQTKEFEKRAKIPCSIELPDETIDCSPDRATAMFRILQEALTNVARHADATRAAVRVMRSEDRIVLEVSDDGRGMTEAQAESSQSFGLLGMEERARELGGALRVKTGRPRGTTITVSIPY